MVVNAVSCWLSHYTELIQCGITTQNIKLYSFSYYFIRQDMKYQISQCNLGSCCYTAVNAKPEGKRHLKRCKHVLHRANIISRKKGVKEFHTARRTDRLSMQIICTRLGLHSYRWMFAFPASLRAKLCYTELQHIFMFIPA